MIKGLYDQTKIITSNSTPYRPKINEAEEGGNKNIKKIFEKMTTTYKYWHDKLPFAYMLTELQFALQDRRYTILLRLLYGSSSTGRSLDAVTMHYHGSQVGGT